MGLKFHHLVHNSTPQDRNTWSQYISSRSICFKNHSTATSISASWIFKWRFSFMFTDCFCMFSKVFPQKPLVQNLEFWGRSRAVCVQQKRMPFVFNLASFACAVFMTSHFFSHLRFNFFFVPSVKCACTTCGTVYRFFSPLKYPNLLWVPLSLLFSLNWWLGSWAVNTRLKMIRTFHSDFRMLF